MRLSVVLCLFSCWSFTAYSQLIFSDNFSGTTLDEAWIGDRDSFIINAEKELQLMAQTGGTSQLAVAVTNADSCAWFIDLRMDFSPSSSNAAQVYLMADQPDLQTAEQAYFLQIGEGGSQDKIEFKSRTGNISTTLLQATEGAVAVNPHIRIHIIRNADAQWNLRADYMDGNGWVDEGTFTDATYNRLGYFGWVCNYTSTRTDKFSFDNVQIGPLYVDTETPKLLSAQALDENHVRLTFNEALSPAVATDRNAYAIDNGIVVGEAIMSDPRTVVLTVSELLSGQTYQVTASGITDENGNTATLLNTEFDFLKIEAPASFDVLIHEIFADPNPPLVLPEVEWIELYNRSNKNIQLNQLQWVNGSSASALPDFVLTAGGYALLCDEEDVSALSVLGEHVLGIDGFGSLTNSGERISILHEDGTIIHSVAYSSTWYGDNSKAAGGYSLEMINPLQPCVTDGNWSASIDPSGATPLRANSIRNEELELGRLQLERAFPITEQNIDLYFDRAVHLSTAADPDLYRVSDREVLSAVIVNEAATQVSLTLDEPLDQGVVYDVQVLSIFEDCTGRTLGNNQSVSVAIPLFPQSRDIIINEVLFEPPTGSSEFIELYNRSDRTIDLAQLIIGKRDGKARIYAAKPIVQPYLLFPGSYVAIAKEPATILSNYRVLDPSALIANDMPSLLNDQDSIVIYAVDFPDSNIVVIDEFYYDDDMHSPLLNNEKGVSLERIHPELPSMSGSSWQSAAQTAGFATPTYRNSQYVDFQQDTSSTMDFQVRIDNPRFSPDGDGFEDVLLATYRSAASGYIGTAVIYDAHGRAVKHLLRSASMAQSGVMRWDGSTDDGYKALTGIYILWVEAFRENGEKTVIKKAVVLAGQL